MSRTADRYAARRNPRIRADDPEPLINDLLDDPVLQILMRRDGVAREDLLELVDAARLRIDAAAFEATLFAECRT